QVYPPPPEFAERARIRSLDDYRREYARSLAEPDAFWAEQARRIEWFQTFDTVSRWDFQTGEGGWYLGGRTNVAWTCRRRPVAGARRVKAALVWEGDSPGESRTLT